MCRFSAAWGVLRHSRQLVGGCGVPSHKYLSTTEAASLLTDIIMMIGKTPFDQLKSNEQKEKIFFKGRS